MEELRNESYKEYAVRNSNINFAGNKPIYVFIQSGIARIQQTTQEEFDVLENTFDSEFDYSDNPCCGIYCKR